jgi:hypothetical protein
LQACWLANDFENALGTVPDQKQTGSLSVRRYRTVASLYLQTAAFRPAQKWTLLAQAYEWERLAMHFTIPDCQSAWEMVAAA